MIETYDEAISWIHGRLRLGVKPGLKRMEWMMEQLGNPEQKMKAVHIGGTNGKGSTVTFLRSILQASKLTVGTFTSPYFETFNERISVNGLPITDEEWLKLVQMIEPLANQMEESELGSPTEFEVITAMMFVYFGDINPVDIVLIEVGLGGRLDSTNIISPIASVITSIGLDHVAILGDTYTQIAFEKAGIIKTSVPVVANIKREDAKEVIKEVAKKQHAPVLFYSENFHAVIQPFEQLGERFVYLEGEESLQAEIQMVGEHQIENASLAIKTFQLIHEELGVLFNEDMIRTGMKKALWPGRMEIVNQSPIVVMDGAHNVEGIEALVHTLHRIFPGKKAHILFAAVADKDLSKMVSMLDEAGTSIAFTSFDLPRAAAAEALYEISSHQQKSIVNWQKWVENHLLKDPSDELLVITGSLYFLSSISADLRIMLRIRNNK
ncbi:bifunctional folylpolyglutamate synthase/dihydrofolate synthase [Jeotgalibacillus soli]|uniref:Dihydrofolate synthase/folylpolyglutamate synthase n=1 Tax=Jeotgalibacillus soli TaxID=889306 RepID=A0A0C2VJB3_9BACL|nr:folylpolyglutamate synthase/dihydrofolate synthase family protein [Jeotgalibacillus soli]KIL44571.1 folylpolyglutamate synthase [Jeotgalibacillus soli]